MEVKVRYSDEELEEFRQLILEKLEVAKRDYETLMDQLADRKGNGVDDTSPTFHALEEGAAAEVYSGTAGCTGENRKQNLRCLPRDWKTDSQGAPARSAARHTQH